MFATRSLARVTVLGMLLATTGMVAGGRTLGAHSSGIAGPPWISIETPVNPYDASTKDAFLLVHAFHHGSPVALPVTGSAEGMVNGERTSVALQFTATSRAGAFALKKQWGDAGIWTLVITVHQHENDVAQALVEIGADGEVSRVQVPTRVGERDFKVPRQISAQEVDRGLRQRARAVVSTR